MTLSETRAPCFDYLVNGGNDRADSARQRCNAEVLYRYPNFTHLPGIRSHDSGSRVKAPKEDIQWRSSAPKSGGHKFFSRKVKSKKKKKKKKVTAA